jgi:FixJ family two-component response regulator
MFDLNPTVFIVDADASVQASLEGVIRRTGWSSETFPSVAEFLARRRLLAPSCLVLDITLPELASFDLLRRIAADRQETPVIAISAEDDIPMTVRAMKAGVVDFLVKPLADDALLAGVGHAIARSHAVLTQVAELLELRRRYNSLSSRERQVMGRVVAGQLNKQVGVALGISEITVKAHRGRVMRKMGGIAGRAGDHGHAARVAADGAHLTTVRRCSAHSVRRGRHYGERLRGDGGRHGSMMAA